MFPDSPNQDRSSVRWFAVGLATLSLIALSVTSWILWTVKREQELVADLIRHLPPSDMAAAQELSGDLRSQLGLTILLVVNLIATAIAFTWLVRGYLNSERSLRDVRVLSADILASMDAGVITTDRDGNLTSINPSGRELVNLAGEEMGRPLTTLGSDHQLLATIQAEVSEHHQRIRDRDYVIKCNGQSKTLRAGCTLLRNQSGSEIGTVLHVRDVTQKSLMEDQLRRMERYMGLGALAAGLQHEIKNPLSAMSLHIQLLCEWQSEGTAGPERDQDINETLEILRSEMKRINDVLDGFRNYASTTHLGRTDVNVPAMIQKLVRLLRLQAESQDVVITMDLPTKS
ncbi:MAG: histidine kinase dimerization/phospho-acceptor domain-containing protein, partial [Rubripirellula sp.]